jgi:peptidoglycan/LPS O-acetylase OafA/YrhL
MHVDANSPYRNEIRALTGIRGVAACMVVFYHYFQDSSGFGPAHALIVHSYMAVDLFFVLSGFVMALTYALSFSHEFSGAAYASFLGKRLGRVYPLYFVVTATVAALLYAHSIAGGPPSFGEVLSNVLMVQAWGFADSIGGPTWSISTEFAAYLAFPILVTLVLLGRRYRCWLAIAAALVTLSTLSGLNPVVLNQVSDGLASRSGPLDIFGTGTLYPLLRCFAGFVLGLAAFRLSKECVLQQIFDWRHTGDVAALIVVGLWGVRGTDVALEIAFVPLVMALASGRSWAARAMGAGVVFWLGEVSYSIYLVHRPVESLIRNPLVAMLNAHHIPHAYTVAGFVPLVLTIALSALTFYCIEKPARDVSRQLMRSKAALLHE